MLRLPPLVGAPPLKGPSPPLHPSLPPGKTASFAIPMIHSCLTCGVATRRGDGPLGLVMAPTRELAQQIEKEFKVRPPLFPP